MIRASKSGGLGELLAVAFPLIVFNACDTVMVVTDRIFLSKLAPEIMNASLGGGLFFVAVTTFFVGIINYSTAIVAQYLGARKKEFCSKVVSQSFFIALFSYPIILASLFFVEYFFEFIRVTDKQLPYQLIYFKILIFGSIGALLRAVFNSFFTGLGRTKIVMISALSATLVNICVNYILIFGKFGFPALGIFGAGIGTISGSVVALTILIVAYFRKSNVKEFSVRNSFNGSFEVLKKLLRFGIPGGIELFLEVFSFYLIAVIFQSKGDVSSTAVSIMFSWDMVAYVPLIGIQVGITSLVGRYMGANDIKRVREVIFSGLKMCSVYSVFILVLFLTFPKQLALIFKPASDSLIFNQAFPISVSMLRAASVYIVGTIFFIVMIGVLHGAGDTLVSMILSLVGNFLMLVALFLALHIFDFSILASWWVVVLSFLFTFTLVAIRFFTGKWKSINIV